MVLDGAVDPEPSAAQFSSAQFTAFQTSFDQLAAGCATDPTVH